MGKKELEELKWWEVIALTIFLSNSKYMNNSEIIHSPIITKYLRSKSNNSVPQTISKTLNVHSTGDVSDDIHRQEPYVFSKNFEGSWYLSEAGEMHAQIIFDQVL